MIRRILPLALPVLVLCSAGPASSKPKKLEGQPQALAELEAKVKDLEKSKDPRADFDALATWLDVPVTCAKDACDKISAKWLVGNLDDDAPDERVLAITTKGTGTCAPASLEVFVFDATSKTDVRVLGHAHAAVSGAKLADVSLANVHSSALKDVVVRTEGQCGAAAAEHVVRIYTLETGRLEELVTSEDWAGTSLVSHAFVGTAPVAIELSTAKGKTKLAWDPAQGYDPFPSYDQAKKSALSASDDETLGTKECAAPLGSDVALDCKLRGSAKVDVLVQNGKALGMTVATTPVDRDFAHCLRKKLSTTTWKSAGAASGCTRTWAVK